MPILKNKILYKYLRMYLKILENNKGKPNSKLINGKKIKIK